MGNAARSVAISVKVNKDGTFTLSPSQFSHAIPLSCPHCGATIQNVTALGTDAKWQMAMKCCQNTNWAATKALVFQCGHCSKNMVEFVREGSGPTETVVLE